MFLMNISMPISCVPISPGSAEADIWCGGNLCGHSMASCVNRKLLKPGHTSSSYNR